MTTADDRWADIVHLPATGDTDDNDAYMASLIAEHETTAAQQQQRPADEPATPDLPNLPDDFWAARPELKHIRDAAHSRACSADAVFYAVLARLSAMVDPNLRFNVGLNDGSLNLFVAAVGGSGAGKTTAAKVAADLVHTPAHLNRTTEDGKPVFLDGLPLGSGEGMAEAFMGVVSHDTDDIDRKGKTKTIRVRQQVRHNAFFSVDEGEQLTRTLERAGATIGSAIRSAWVGAVLGQANASEDRMRVIPAGTYSLGMLIGYQPDTAAPLLADSGPGTPQRFVWCSAHDPSIPEQRIDHPGPLYISVTHPGSGWPLTGVMPATDEIRDELWTRKVRLARGEDTVEPLDAHEPLLRAKIAALLALIDGRTDITAEDWDLSATVWATSCGVRDGLLQIGATARQKEREQRTRDRVEQALRVEAAVTNMPSTIKRIAEKLGRRVTEEGHLTNGAAWRALSGRDRQQGRELFEAALDYGAGEGLFLRGPHGLTAIDEASR